MKNSVQTELPNDSYDVKVVGRYEILRKLGQGSAGIVFLAKDPYIERNLALKIYHPASDPARKKFFVEAQSAGRLHHPNIVTIYDAGMHGDLCYLAMEYIDGPTLAKFCSKDGLLPLPDAIKIALKLCLGLDYAHKQGIVHRDIKPSNILIDKYMVPKISDFGIAHIPEQAPELGLFGTPSYMPPEQLREQAVGLQGDIFALGCVFYELLTGKRAFCGDNNFITIYKVMNEEPSPVSTLRPNLPKALDAITGKALKKTPGERYRDCVEFAHHLRKILLQLDGSKKKSEQVFIEFVKGIPFFRNFSRRQVEELLSSARIFDAPKGKKIVNEGNLDSSFFIVLSGRCKVSKNNRDIAFIESGECFGEMSHLADQPRTATVIAETNCLFIEFSAILMEKLPQSIQLIFYKNFAKTLASRLAKTSAKR